MITKRTCLEKLDCKPKFISVLKIYMEIDPLFLKYKKYKKKYVSLKRSLMHIGGREDTTSQHQFIIYAFHSERCPHSAKTRTLFQNKKNTIIIDVRDNDKHEFCEGHKSNVDSKTHKLVKQPKNNYTVNHYIYTFPQIYYVSYKNCIDCSVSSNTDYSVVFIGGNSDIHSLITTLNNNNENVKNPSLLEKYNKHVCDCVKIDALKAIFDEFVGVKK